MKEKIEALLQFVLDRLSEKSTWVGIIAILTELIGKELSPAMQGAVESFGLAAVGLILVLLKEKVHLVPHPDAPQTPPAPVEPPKADDFKIS